MLLNQPLRVRSSACSVFSSVSLVRLKMRSSGRLLVVAASSIGLRGRCVERQLRCERSA